MRREAGRGGEPEGQQEKDPELTSDEDQALQRGAQGTEPLGATHHRTGTPPPA